MKLQCAGCGAPLEITPDLDTFACSYCGTNQRVERKGGIVALKRVEAAIQAVQRGTDRTAAELALVRLGKEIADAQEKRALAVKMTWVKIDAARNSRFWKTLFTFFLTAIVLAVALESAKSGKGGPYESMLNWAIFILSIVAAVFTFRRAKIPEGEMQRITALWDEHLAKLNAQLAANRAILDNVPLAA